MRTDCAHCLIEHRAQSDPRVAQACDAIGKAVVRPIAHVACTSTATLLQYDGFNIFIADVEQGCFKVLYRQIDMSTTDEIVTGIVVRTMRSCMRA